MPELGAIRLSRIWRQVFSARHERREFRHAASPMCVRWHHTVSNLMHAVFFCLPW